VGKDKKKEFDKETRQMKKAIKSKADWMREAQDAFNGFIRVRDAGRPCISCDKPNDGYHQRHASHYRSVKACSALRFNTWNVHASCMQCNAILSGNLVEYRVRLTKKIGAGRVELLDNCNDIARYDIEYLKRVKRIFTKRANMLK
jgi:hypothetical protein